MVNKCCSSSDSDANINTAIPYPATTGPNSPVQAVSNAGNAGEDGIQSLNRKNVTCADVDTTSAKFGESRLHAANLHASQSDPFYHDQDEHSHEQQQQQVNYLISDGTRRCVSADAVLTPASASEYFSSPYSPFGHVQQEVQGRTTATTHESPPIGTDAKYDYPPHEGDPFAAAYFQHQRQQRRHQQPAMRSPGGRGQYPSATGAAHSHSQESYFDEVNWTGEPVRELLGTVITSQGFITLRLRNNIWLYMTVDKAIRIVNYETNIIMALSACGTKSGFIHPSGSVYQYCTLDPESSNSHHELGYDTRIELSTHVQFGPQKYAKISNKGITFSGDDHALIYVVDQAGTRSTSATFSDLTGDFCLPVFLDTSTHAPIAINECGRLLQTAQFWTGPDGTENWIINGIRIAQEADGSLRVAHDSLRYQLRSNPRNGNGSISTPHIHCTASLYGHLFIRRGSKRVHFDGRQLIARNGSHSSGFDYHNRLKLF